MLQNWEETVLASGDEGEDPCFSNDAWKEAATRATRMHQNTQQKRSLGAGSASSAPAFEVSSAAGWQSHKKSRSGDATPTEFGSSVASSASRDEPTTPPEVHSTDPNAAVTMATLNEALGKWTLGMQKEISTSSRQMEANVQSALQKHGQTLVLSLNEILA
eukprot:12403724-Karenia_brevis.AAC.1